MLPDHVQERMAMITCLWLLTYFTFFDEPRQTLNQ